MDSIVRGNFYCTDTLYCFSLFFTYFLTSLKLELCIFNSFIGEICDQDCFNFIYFLLPVMITCSFSVCKWQSTMLETDILAAVMMISFFSEEFFCHGCRYANITYSVLCTYHFVYVRMFYEKWLYAYQAIGCQLMQPNMNIVFGFKKYPCTMHICIYMFMYSYLCVQHVCTVLSTA